MSKNLRQLLNRFGLASRPVSALALLALCGLLTACEGTTGAERSKGVKSPKPTPSLGSEKYLVQLREGEGLEALEELGVDTTTAERVYQNLWEVDFPKESASRLVRSANQSPRVAYAHPDHELYAHAVPNDPQYSRQWAHQNVKSAEAWDIAIGDEAILVSVIDTGVDYDHPDLRENIWTNEGEIPNNGRDDDNNGLVDDVHGYDFANRDSDPMADDSPTFHGTHVSGIIGAVANNGEGIAGHSHQVKILACKFLRSDGRGSTADAIRCIDYSIQQGVKIINNSWGGGDADPSLEAAIARAERAGILFIVSAGNGGPDQRGDDNDRIPSYPASYPNPAIVSVAATDSGDRLTSFSNYGARSVDVAGPGAQIYSTQNGGRYQNISGTSMSAPLVTGLAVLIASLQPSWTPSQIKNVLIGSSDPVAALRGRVVANGRVNALKAVQAAQSGDPNPDPGPAPDPDPNPNPNPSPNPGVARAPMLGGTTTLRTSDPWTYIPIDYDVSEFAGTAGIYLEVSRHQTPFREPNGQVPDSNRLTSTMGQGVRGRIQMMPGVVFPGWGVYQIRIIPLDANRRPTGSFSNSATLQLLPPGLYFGFNLDSGFK